MDICDNSLDANKDVGNLHSNTLNNNQDINPTTVKLKDGASSKNTHITTDFTLNNQKAIDYKICSW